MRKMKDSKIKWIGELPQDWEIDKIKYHFSIISGNGFPVDIQGQEVGDFPVCKASDISKNNGDIIKHSANYITKSQATAFNIIPKGSVVFAKIGEALKKNNRAIFGIDGCLDNNCQGLVPKDIKSKYALYLLSCIDMSWFDNAGTIPCVNNTKLNNCRIPFPPLAEQQKIADFLDDKCSKINSLYSGIEKQIETLKEYKKSVIYEAVTNGLDKTVEMKDSQTTWLGEIPNSWEISRINNVYTLRNTKVSDKDYEPLSVTMNGVLPQLETVAKSDAHDDRKLVKKGDFAINSRSDRRGSCGIADRDGSVSLINIILKPKKEMNPKYYNWLFHTSEFADEFYANGHGIVDDLWTTGWQEMKKILIPMPSLKEQEEIASFLDKKCSQIDEIISLKEKELETLEGYKKSLIYEYVTGKKEVE